MIELLDRLARRLLYALDPEDAHRLAIRMLRIAPLPTAGPDDSRLATRVFGLNFPNPIGIAAGFDKHAEIPDALLRAGFGGSRPGREPAASSASMSAPTKTQPIVSPIMYA